MPRIWIHSPNLVVNESLAQYVANLGYKTQLEPEDADMAIVNLYGQRSPFLPPPPLRTLALLCTANKDEMLELLRLGYRGCHRPEDTPEQFAAAIKAVWDGELWADKDLIEEAKEPLDVPRLTLREAQVMSFLALGLSNKRIARQLGIAEKTVKIYVASLLQKHQAKNRVDLLVRRSPPVAESNGNGLWSAGQAYR